MSHIHLANNANRPIQCIALPNAEWMCSDTELSDALRINGDSLKESSAGFIEVYKAAAHGRWTLDFEKAVGRLFEENGDKIYPSEVLDVFNTSYWETPLESLNSSMTGGLFGYAASVILLLRTDDGRFSCALETTNDVAWIIQKQGDGYFAIRAQTGHLWIPAPNSEQFTFDPVVLKEVLSEKANFQLTK